MMKNFVIHLYNKGITKVLVYTFHQTYMYLTAESMSYVQRTFGDPLAYTNVLKEVLM